jgi:hypothetical protein
MRHPKIFTGVIAIQFLFGILASTASAGGGTSASQKPDFETPELIKRSLLKKLHLTRPQLDRIRKYRAVYRKQTAEIDAQTSLIQVELENEMEKAKPDRGRLAALCRQFGKLTGDEVMNKVQFRVELERGVLTSPQLDALLDMEDWEYPGNGPLFQPQ